MLSSRRSSCRGQFLFTAANKEVLRSQAISLLSRLLWYDRSQFKRFLGRLAASREIPFLMGYEAFISHKAPYYFRSVPRGNLISLPNLGSCTGTSASARNRAIWVVRRPCRPQVRIAATLLHMFSRSACCPHYFVIGSLLTDSLLGDWGLLYVRRKAIYVYQLSVESPPISIAEDFMLFALGAPKRLLCIQGATYFPGVLECS